METNLTCLIESGCCLFILRQLGQGRAKVKPRERILRVGQCFLLRSLCGHLCGFGYVSAITKDITDESFFFRLIEDDERAIEILPQRVKVIIRFGHTTSVLTSS